MNASRAIAGLFALTPFGLLLATNQPAQKVNFGTDIEPIFKAHCSSCHAGPGSSAKLDLASLESIQKGGRGGKLLVPGKPDESLLMIRLLGQGGMPQMPMGFKPLAKEELDKIRLWIEQGGSTAGAERARHWAYDKPVQPTLPAVHQASWVRNPIDAFVLSNLEHNGLRPSPEAPKEILLRRVYLDLIGLPPTVREIDAFLADKSPNAYEKVVDRLLASKHYGERQARPWLDLARYADSDGYEKDLNRVAWKYRDWVIEAFNKNLPYDQFTIQQLAGDLLPNPTTDNLVATGFHRNTMFNREGGVDQAEAHYNVILDRVNTTATVWLGSTFMCTRCHDHKYDPFTQKDYFKLAAYFSNAVILPRGSASVGEEKWFESEIRIPSGQQTAEKVRLQQLKTKVVQERDEVLKGSESSFQKWLQQNSSDIHWEFIKTSSTNSSGHATFTEQPDGSLLVSGPNSPKDTYTVSGHTKPLKATGLKLDVLPDSSLPNNGPGRASNFVLTGLSIHVGKQEIPLSDIRTDMSQEGYNPARILAHDTNSGWAIYPGNGKPHTLVVTFKNPVDVSLADLITVRLEQQSPWENHNIGRLRLSLTDDAEPLRSAVPANIQALLAATDRKASGEQELRNYFLTTSPIFKSANEKVKDVDSKLAELEASIPTALIMKDKPTTKALTAFVHSRGEFLSPTVEVTAGTPALFGQTDPALPSNRLGLAKWIASKDNPLTARVEVNRIWEQYFGRGIVETCEDFGTQGAKPVNQPLLDWLATEFMAKNWDLKAVHRMIVLSSTYRQSSNATLDLLKKDPLNLLLARGPRFRLEAEIMRDSVLTEAGLLNPTIGGPSVFPSQPIAWDTPYNGEQWMTSKGGDAYRRGIYTFWKRSAPYPSFMAFDATSREECTVRRIRTNTPLQALAMLNDGAVFGAAKALGHTMAVIGNSDTDKLVYGFRSTTGRHPKPAELSRLNQLLTKLKTRYAKDPQLAKKVATRPTEAPYVLTANVLLNLDEALTKG